MVTPAAALASEKLALNVRPDEGGTASATIPLLSLLTEYDHCYRSRFPYTAMCQRSPEVVRKWILGGKAFATAVMAALPPTTTAYLEIDASRIKGKSRLQSAPPQNQ
ncbi:MAG: hypothetical protein U0T81_13470 [Saprospiraceae bacterium]